MKFGGDVKESAQHSTNQVTGNANEKKQPTKKSQAQNAQVSAVRQAKPNLDRFKRLYESEDSDDCSTSMISCVYNGEVIEANKGPW